MAFAFSIYTVFILGFFSYTVSLVSVINLWDVLHRFKTTVFPMESYISGYESREDSSIPTSQQCACQIETCDLWQSPYNYFLNHHEAYIKFGNPIHSVLIPRLLESYLARGTSALLFKYSPESRPGYLFIACLKLTPDKTAYNIDFARSDNRKESLCL